MREIKFRAWHKENKQNAKVVFEKGCFFADLGDRFAYHIYEVADNCEVIGNIHENSELLKWLMQNTTQELKFQRAI